jgi:hypothetical protein
VRELMTREPRAELDDVTLFGPPAGG